MLAEINITSDDYVLKSIAGFKAFFNKVKTLNKELSMLNTVIPEL